MEEYSDEDYTRGRLVDQLQVATTNRGIVRERVHSGAYRSRVEAAEALALARAGVDRAEAALFEHDLAHPCKKA